MLRRFWTLVSSIVFISLCSGCARAPMPNSAVPPKALTKEQSFEIAKKTLASLPHGDEYAIIEDDTIERPFGWVFRYDTKKYLETKDPKYIRPGNGPLVVERVGGTTAFLPTSLPPRKAIEEFERR